MSGDATHQTGSMHCGDVRVHIDVLLDADGPELRHRDAGTSTSRICSRTQREMQVLPVLGFLSPADDTDATVEYCENRVGIYFR